MSTVANLYYIQEGFLMNFVRRMELLKVHSYMIGAFDEQSYHWMKDRDIPCVLVTRELPSTEFGWFKDHKAFKLRVS